MKKPFLEQIAEMRGQLRKSEAKVADFVLKHAAQVVHMRIVDFAQETSVSEPTVIRFCRAVGTNGFQAFKVKLADALARQWDADQFSIAAEDSIEDIASKVFNANIQGIRSIFNQIDYQSLEQAVQQLLAAKRLEFHGSGASGMVAMDAQHKFFRLIPACIAHVDPHMQAMSASTLQSGDVLISISQSGTSQAIRHAATIAHKQGATLIGICPGSSPLGQQVDILLPVEIEENNQLHTPMLSRILDLTLLDVLAAALAKEQGNLFQQRQQQIKDSIKPLK